MLWKMLPWHVIMVTYLIMILPITLIITTVVWSSALNDHLRITREHSSRMRTDHAVTRMSNDRVVMRPIVDRQTPIKTLLSLAVGKYVWWTMLSALHDWLQMCVTICTQELLLVRVTDEHVLIWGEISITQTVVIWRHVNMINWPHFCVNLCDLDRFPQSKSEGDNGNFLWCLLDVQLVCLRGTSVS